MDVGLQRADFIPQQLVALLFVFEHFLKQHVLSHEHLLRLVVVRALTTKLLSLGV